MCCGREAGERCPSNLPPMQPLADRAEVRAGPLLPLRAATCPLC